MVGVLNMVGAGLVREDQIDIPKVADLSTVSTNLYGLVFLVAGGVAVIIIILAGIKFITSQGDPQATAKARNAIIYAAIGLAISITSFSIVLFVVERL